MREDPKAPGGTVDSRKAVRKLYREIETVDDSEITPDLPNLQCSETHP
jgi:hypothetical protein